MSLTLVFWLGSAACAVEAASHSEATTCATCAAHPPRGIYALDGPQGTLVDGVSMRNTNIRGADFVAGYAWRWSWARLEPQENAYDFSAIDFIIAQLEPLGKKLTLHLTDHAGESGDPDYIVSAPGVTTYTYLNPLGQTLTKAVPWDPLVRARFEAFMTALAEHPVPNAAAGGTLTPLRNHPVLGWIRVGVGVGHGYLREERSSELADLPGYTRPGFVEAIKTGLHSVTNNFPKTYVQIGFWKITDCVPNPCVDSPALWEDMQSALVTEFGERVGFFMENLAASKDTTSGVVTGYPNTTFAAPLYLSQGSTHICFQALQGWRQPFSDPNNTANATPNDGLRYGYDTFAAKYFELYVADLDYPPYAASFATWNSLLFE